MGIDDQAVTTAEQIALWADRLRDISALGLRFTENGYDQERYRAVQDIAMAMLAMATDESLADLEPLRGPIFSRPTPFVGGDGAVIDDEGRILLIQRADNALWAIPGGALEVGETAAEGVVREVLEETGVHCRPVALVGVFDAKPRDFSSQFHLYVIAFLCRLVDDVEFGDPTHSNETLDVRWFSEDELPDECFSGHRLRISNAFRIWRNGGQAYFDGQG